MYCEWVTYVNVSDGYGCGVDGYPCVSNRFVLRMLTFSMKTGLLRWVTFLFRMDIGVL